MKIKLKMSVERLVNKINSLGYRVTINYEEGEIYFPMSHVEQTKDLGGHDIINIIVGDEIKLSIYYHYIRDYKNGIIYMN